MSEFGTPRAVVFALAALCAVALAVLDFRRKRPRGAVFWGIFALLLGAVAWHHQSAWLFTFTENARRSAYSGGWYDSRRSFQTEVTMIGLAGAVAIFVGGAAFLFERGRRFAGAFMASLYLLALHGLRTVSLHQVDAAAGLPFLGRPAILWALDLGVVLTFAALIQGAIAVARPERRPKPRDPKPSPTPTNPGVVIGARAVGPLDGALAGLLAANIYLVNHTAVVGPMLVAQTVCRIVLDFGLALVLGLAARSGGDRNWRIDTISAVRASPILAATGLILWAKLIVGPLRSGTFGGFDVLLVLEPILLVSLGAVWFVRARNPRALLVALVAGPCLLALEGAIRVSQAGDFADAIRNILRWNELPFESPSRLSAGIGYHNYLAMVFTIGGSAAVSQVRLSRAGAERVGAERVGWLCAVVALFLATALTGSRGNWAFYLLVLMLHLARLGPVWRASALGVATLGFMAIVLRVVFSAGGLLRGDSSLKTRWHMMKVAMLIARDNPVFGGGPRAFGELWKMYGPTHGVGTLYAQPDSWWFALLAEGGVPLLAAALIFTGALAVATIGRARSSRGAGDRIGSEVLLSLGIALAVASLQALFELSLGNLTVAWTVYLLLGLALGATMRRSANKKIGSGNPDPIG